MVPALATCVISFCHKLTLGYDNKGDLISEELKKNSYTKENIETFDVSKIENNEDFKKLMLDVYKLLNDIIVLISQNWPATLHLKLIPFNQIEIAMNKLAIPS